MAIVGDQPELTTDPVRDFREIRDSGLLWLINRVVFHPRGFALALHFSDGDCIGWSLVGDGSEPWSFAPEADEDHAFECVQQLLRPRPRTDGEG